MRRNFNLKEYQMVAKKYLYSYIDFYVSLFKKECSNIKRDNNLSIGLGYKNMYA